MIPADPRPLAGITVVDLSRVLAGPFCTLVLGNLGARVIKVERPEGGDDARAVGPFVGGKSLYFAALNYGKESIALDLKRDADRAIFADLLGAADVLVENFRPGAMERLGYGWEALYPRWPRLIYGAASGFGHTGPLRERPAFDMVVQAMGGILSLAGHPGQPPARVGVSIGDIAAGLFLAVGIHAALLLRGRTGEGTKVDVGMLDCQLAILENALTTHLVTGQVPGPQGTRHPNIAPFQAFTAGDGRPLVICAGHDNLFTKLCDAIARPELPRDPRFGNADARRSNADALEEAIEEALRARSAAEWLALLEREGVPCAPINTVAEAVRNPQVAARNMVVEIADHAIGSLWVAGNPIKLSGVPEAEHRRPPPELDGDRAAILTWLRQRCAPLVLAAVLALAGCSGRSPRVALDPLASGLDAYLAAHPVALGQPIRADEVGQTASASYHLVQACGSERPHRHATHDLTAFVLRGRGTLARDGSRIAMAPGDAAVVARGTAHWFASADGGCAVALVVFSPPLDAPDTVPVDSLEGGR